MKEQKKDTKHILLFNLRYVIITLFYVENKLTFVVKLTKVEFFTDQNIHATTQFFNLFNYFLLSSCDMKTI